MGRPLSYDRRGVIVASMDTFWSGGYGATCIQSLEDATGLARSSIYAGFHSKWGLFQAAIEEYDKGFISPLLAGMEGPGAGLSNVAAYFSSLGALFRGPVSGRGCLMVNSICELAAREADFTPEAERWCNRLRRAFGHALGSAARRGEVESGLVARRARWLSAAAMGAWVAARADPRAAAADCRAIANEVVSWLPPALRPEAAAAVRKAGRIR